MQWIEDGSKHHKRAKEVRNSSSVLEHREFVTNAVADVMNEKAIMAFSLG
jgi:hypothetical protein